MLLDPPLDPLRDSYAFVSHSSNHGGRSGERGSQHCTHCNYCNHYGQVEVECLTKVREQSKQVNMAQVASPTPTANVTIFSC